MEEELKKVAGRMVWWMGGSVVGRIDPRDLGGGGACLDLGVLGLRTPAAKIPLLLRGPFLHTPGDSPFQGELLSRYFWEDFFSSFILAFIVDIPRTVKQD